MKLPHLPHSVPHAPGWYVIINAAFQCVYSANPGKSVYPFVELLFQSSHCLNRLKVNLFNHKSYNLYPVSPRLLAPGTVNRRSSKTPTQCMPPRPTNLLQTNPQGICTFIYLFIYLRETASRCKL